MSHIEERLTHIERGGNMDELEYRLSQVEKRDTSHLEKRLREVEGMP